VDILVFVPVGPLALSRQIPRGRWRGRQEIRPLVCYQRPGCLDSMRVEADLSCCLSCQGLWAVKNPFVGYKGV
jgi:hypothetical protein